MNTTYNLSLEISVSVRYRSQRSVRRSRVMASMGSKFLQEVAASMGACNSSRWSLVDDDPTQGSGRYSVTVELFSNTMEGNTSTISLDKETYTVPMITKRLVDLSQTSTVYLVSLKMIMMLENGVSFKKQWVLGDNHLRDTFNAP